MADDGGSDKPASDISSPTQQTPSQLAHEELKLTFEYQVQRLQEIDEKAIEILKANLLLIGIVVTGGSILIQTELPVGVFLNFFTVVGGLLLLLSTGLAAVTYTASNLRGGLDSDAVESALASDDGEFEPRLLRSYADWIAYNARVTAVNDLLASITVLLVFVAFVYVVAGVAVGAVGLSTVGSAAAFVVLTVVMGGFTWAGFHMDHLGVDPQQQSDSFSGIRLSKGATRKDGVQALREMLTTDSDDESDFS